MNIFNVNTPSLKVFILNHYLNNDINDNSFTEGYLTSVKSIDGNSLSFTVLLETGALFSNLPIESIYIKKYNDINMNIKFNTRQLQPYSCLDGSIQVIEYELLKHCDVKCLIGFNSIKGVYLFTIDYNGSSLADDPEQRKTHNIIALENGQLAALPNNKCLFLNKSLTDNKDNKFPKYKRTEKYYRSES